MLVNNQEICLKEPISLSRFLQQQGYRLDLIAVELNYQIIKQNTFDSITLNNTDKLEIVSFVGGG